MVHRGIITPLISQQMPRLFALFDFVDAEKERQFIDVTSPICLTFPRCFNDWEEEEKLLSLPRR